jgi:hypothetical protein
VRGAQLWLAGAEEARTTELKIGWHRDAATARAEMSRQTVEEGDANAAQHGAPLCSRRWSHFAVHGALPVGLTLHSFFLSHPLCIPDSFHILRTNMSDSAVAAAPPASVAAAVAASSTPAAAAAVSASSPIPAQSAVPSAATANVVAASSANAVAPSASASGAASSPAAASAASVANSKAAAPSLAQSSPSPNANLTPAVWNPAASHPSLVGAPSIPFMGGRYTGGLVSSNGQQLPHGYGVLDKGESPANSSQPVGIQFRGQWVSGTLPVGVRNCARERLHYEGQFNERLEREGMGIEWRVVETPLPNAPPAPPAGSPTPPQQTRIIGEVHRAGRWVREERVAECPVPRRLLTESRFLSEFDKAHQELDVILSDGTAGRYEGEKNAKGEPHGKGRVLNAKGEAVAGENWVDGAQEGEG